MRIYCTYFDHNYLRRGLALYRSLLRHDPDVTLWVLCLSARCHEILTELALPGIKTLALTELQRVDPELASTRSNRSLVEYFFTCTASLMLHVIERSPAGQIVTYLDSDMYFFDSPDSIFREIADRSIAIVPHRFPPSLAYLADRGIYNVGWVSIRHDEHGLACVRWWRARCIEWCYDLIEQNRFADQKYLDRWPQLFQNIAILGHKGVNTAPYNLSNYTVASRENKIFIDADPLVIFHFHGFKQINAILYDPNLSDYQTRATRVIRRDIYGAYIRALRLARQELNRIEPARPHAGFVENSVRTAPLKLDPLRRVVNRWRIFRRRIQYIIEGKQLFYIAGRVL